MIEPYFLGVDVGGTKSHALITDSAGRALGLGTAGPGNWEMIGWAGAGEVLQTIVAQACSAAAIHPSQISGAGFGLAGHDWPEDHEPHCRLIDSLGLNAPYECGNDALVGLFAGARQGWGVVIVAGTSNNCRGRSPDGREGRITGSSWLGEYAGAGELVAEAVRAVARAWSYRAPTTLLSDLLVQQTGAHDVADLLAGLMRERYSLTAEHAHLVFQAAAAPDPVAQDLITWAGQELGNNANGVIRQLNIAHLPFEVVLSGSFFNGSPHLITTIRQTIQALAPQASLVRLEVPPVVGGVLWGMQVAGWDAAACRDTLISTTKALLRK